MRTPSIAMAAAAALLLSPPLAADSALRLQAGALHYHFAEYLDGEQLLTESGFIPGVEGSLTAASGDWSLSFNAGYYEGEVAYDGQTQPSDGSEPVTSETLESLGFVGARFSRALYPGGVPVELFFQGHYRTWNRVIRDTTTADGTRVSGIEEFYYWWEPAAGVRLPWRWADGWPIELEAMYLRTVNPRMDVSFQGSDEVTLEMRDRTGYRLSLVQQVPLSASTTVGLRGYLEHWAFGESDPERLTVDGESHPCNCAIFEPRSETNNWGINAVLTTTF